jgi:hypothetical protein
MTGSSPCSAAPAALGGVLAAGAATSVQRPARIRRPTHSIVSHNARALRQARSRTVEVWPIRLAIAHCSRVSTIQPWSMSCMDTMLARLTG